MSNKLAIIILNWNGKKDTLECLQSIYKQHPNPKFSVYLVDNNSTDNSIAAIAKKFPQVKLIQNPSNLGFAKGNNVGINQALKDDHKFICLLNNDTTVSKNFFSKLLKSFAKSKFDIASPKIYFYPGNEFHKQSYKKSERGQIIWYAGGRMDWNHIIPSHLGVDEFDHGQFDTPTQTDFATGCCMIIKKKVIDQIGTLDPKYNMYFEDNDFCQRAIKAGFSVGFLPQVHMWHKNAGSTGGSGSKKQTRLVNQSRLTFAMRHAPLRAKLALIKQNLTKI